MGQKPAALTEAIDWVYANAGKCEWKHIDRTRIGVWGQSCGGLEAYAAGAHDDRVSHLGIFNSGQLSANESEAVAGEITKPVFISWGVRLMSLIRMFDSHPFIYLG
jgi:dienelactone hydrolase